tara:strand:+ start:2446 stop:4572 length:2127 start_codon:yes stop_codon:yes gene_type:complete
MELENEEIFGEEAAPEKMVERETPDVAEARKNLASKWADTVNGDKKHWAPAFNRMRKDQDFAYGKQWSDDEEDDRYVANITIRHIQQRVAALYAKNPKTVARTKQKLMSSTWDGTMSSVMAAMQKVQMAQLQPEMAASPEIAESIALLQEAQQVTDAQEQLDKFAKTLELFYEYNIDEQAHPFKTMMKLLVRRAVTTSVGYVKLGFQRVMEPRPERDAEMADITQKIATAERLSQAVADGEISDDNDSELERLRLIMTDLQAEQDVVLREGLVFDYPSSSSIIPDKNCSQLREFLGCDHVTQEYILSPDRVEEIYGVDIKSDFTTYSVSKSGEAQASNTSDDYSENTDKKSQSLCAVWEIYSRTDGLVYTVCDGYPDFLREPAAPEVWTERFWPWFPLVLNEVDHPTEIFPPSDVRLITQQQKEYNRLRQGLREHRKQNRPLTIASGGALSEDDKEVLTQRPAAALVELDGLQPGQNIRDVLQPMQFSGVDPNLYEVNGTFEDVLRTVGVQEANFGGAGGGTATETSIAESSRMSALQSNIDEIDDLLSNLARNAGQILLDQVSAETVKEAVGPAAVWPEMTRDEMAKEVYLEIEAGSTGRPNQAQEIQNFERMAPLIMQIPGIVPEKLAKEALRRMDDKLRLDDLYDRNLPSINAMNVMAGQAAGGVQQNGGSEAPSEQGANGANNAQRAPGPEGGAPSGPPDIPVQ